MNAKTFLTCYSRQILVINNKGSGNDVVSKASTSKASPNVCCDKGVLLQKEIHN